MLVPRAADRTLRAITCVSGKFPARAPEGVTLLRCALGRSGDGGIAELPEGALEQLAQAELAELFGVVAEPLMARAWRWSGEMPRYTLGHLDRLARIEHMLAELPDLALVGAGYRGIGVPDGIQQGTAQAHALLVRLRAGAARGEAAA